MITSMKVPFNGQSVHARKILIILSIFLIPSFVNAQFIEVTSNTGDYDIWNDVATDSQGNIYVVGTYQNSTQIDGQPISTGIITPKQQFMVAKYNSLGVLIWKTYGVCPCPTKGWSTGEVIAIDESMDRIFIAGRHAGMQVMQGNGLQAPIDDLTVNSVSCAGSDAGQNNYIMHLNMSSGFYVDFYNNLRGPVSAMVVANSGDYNHQLYVALNSNAISWIIRVNTSPLGNTGNFNSIQTTSIYTHSINDIFYRDHHIFCIGTTEGPLSFGAQSISFNPSSQVNTAWAASVNNTISTINVAAINYGGVGGSGSRVMTGDQIYLDNNDNVIIAGLYSEHLINPFSLGSNHTSSNTLATYKDAYIMRLNPANLKANDALKTIETGYNQYEVSQVEIAGLGNDVFVSTTYTGKTLNFIPTSGPNIDLYLSGFNPFVYFGEKIAVMHYASSPVLAKTWHNTTQGLSSNDDKHYSKAMAVFNNLVYTCGNFYERMYFDYDPAYLTPAVSATNGKTSAFLFRNDHTYSTPGTFKSNSKDEIERVIVKTKAITIYPNPNNGSFYINGITKEDKIEAFDVLGKTLAFSLSYYADKVYIEIENPVDIVIVKVNNIGYQVMIHD